MKNFGVERPKENVWNFSIPQCEKLEKKKKYI